MNVKILTINNYHRILGGSDAVFFRTAELLQRAGHIVVAYAAASEGDSPSPYASYFPATLNTRAPRLRDVARYIHNREAARRLDDLIKAEGPFDLAHLHIYYGQLTASILPVLRRHDIPIVQTLHEYKLACPIYTMERDGKVCDDCIEGSTLNVLRHRCKGGSLVHSLAVFAEFWASRLQGDISDISRFICVSDFQRRIMEQAGVPRNKLMTLHNFVDLPSEVPAPNRGRYLLYFGRIEKLKGVGTLVNAARRCNIPLKIAGTGAMAGDLADAIASHPNIEYLGYMSGAPLAGLIANARAVVVPSEWYENCPMSVLEAKAAGVPVLGARVGGIPELIRDGKDGFLFNPGDEEDLLRVIALLDGCDLRRMGDAARHDIAERFAAEAHLAQLLEIYAAARAGRLA
ncbi:glycosyltransferase family 1 protein [Cereibacter johrii]|nr:glycosyltransferase family 1 protein [Cereibacter johrii]